MLCQEKRIKKFVPDKKFKYGLRGKAHSCLEGIEIMKNGSFFSGFLTGTLGKDADRSDYLANQQ